VGAVQFTTAWQDVFADTTILVGHPVITGAVLSTTVTLKLQTADNVPAVAVYVTIVSPTGKAVPGACVLVSAGVATQLSDAVGGVQFTMLLQLLAANTTMSEGQPDNTGGVLSTTVTVNEQVDESDPAVAV
jgi:hypothetical protein